MGARAAGKSKVNWYTQDVILHFGEITRHGLEAVAARIDAQTKINIVQNDQVDTGFMVNSVYFATEEGSSYNDTDKDGLHLNRLGELVEREMAPEAPLPDDYVALVCVGANYAIFQEMQQPFLYPALVQVAGEAGGIIKKVANDA